MSSFKNMMTNLKQDKTLSSILLNSGYLFSSNTVSSLLTTASGVMAAIILGPINYGFLGLIITYASNVNRLLSFRMGELVIKYAGAFLATGQKEKAAGVIKLASLVEIASSVMAYGLLLWTAPLAAQYILKNPELSQWIMIYGIALLANFMTETATAILQLADKYKTMALYNLLQNIITVIWILALFIFQGSLIQVLMAYLVGKFVYGLGLSIAGLQQMSTLVGGNWWRSSIRTLGNKHEIAKFAVSTNLSSTVSLLVRDSEVLWFGFFWSSEIVGYYKFGLAIINPIMMPIDTLIKTTYPEINRLISQRLWTPLKSLLRKTTIISLAWTMACGLGLILLGEWLLGFIKNGSYLPSLPITLILLVGYGLANILFWNRNLLLSLNRPNTPLVIMTIVGVAKIIIMLLTVPKFGYLYQAVLLSLYFVVSVSLISIIGLIHVRREQAGIHAEAV